MTRAFPLILTILILAACGSPRQTKVDAFRARFVAECKAGTMQATGKDMTVVCGCVADKLIANKPIDELTNNPPQEDADRYGAECGREHPIS
jgi:uncharacterized lipoprotein YmbA